MDLRQFVYKKLKIKKSGFAVGKGLIAAEPISKGERVLRFVGVLADNLNSNLESLQVSNNIFFELANLIENFVNHSCNPNCFIDFKRWELVALRDIKIGEEITFNYLTTEYDMVKTKSAFVCNCGDKNCFKYIKGFKYLSLKEKLKLRKYLSPFLKQKLNE